ncbi:3-hydroxyisobutyryl-CoA hydrolase 1 [Zea mays]|uniref:3-hydroxyisobutyryl-CoA hydrolase n=1 Tax=Zea mays TaxID=4577 RepID=A0A1D6F8H4_MAIZE|nr:3-hydroxyisobutyryl-CoA hydrolase 1 [Zea mays]
MVFAMPETFLGHFPDVGASYFLSRLPGFYGEYVALTGARLDGAEMLACGLATHFVPSNRMLLLEESLKKVNTSNSFVVCSTIDQFSQQPSLKQKSSLNRLEIINKCFSKRTVEEIISSLVSLLQWMPTRLEQVHDEAVEEYFSRIDDPRWEDLNLPVICSHGRIMDSKL